MKITIETDDGKVMSLDEVKAYNFLQRYWDINDAMSRISMYHEDIDYSKITGEMMEHLGDKCRDLRFFGQQIETIWDEEDDLYDDAIDELVKEYPEIVKQKEEGEE